ncbi:MAG TPA: type II toxin-antitoxin system Phd/YefM family antitoxin [Acidimicrobiales bacterium]|nr:type II toxin-antitoxin system Phd/YefM family antitoxin [Acidimicrobiales bacterium]
MEVGVHQAKTSLSKLLRRVAAGEEVLITKGGEPVAKLVAVRPETKRVLGRDVGLYTLPEDFDAPLLDEVLSDFEGTG